MAGSGSCCGLLPLAEEGETPEKFLHQTKRLMAANGCQLMRMGHLNRPDSPGIRHAKSLMVSGLDENQTNDLDRALGLGSVGLAVSLTEHFKRMSTPDLEYRLARQKLAAMRKNFTPDKQIDPEAQPDGQTATDKD